MWIDELQLRPREPDRPYTLTPVISATSEAAGFEARRRSTATRRRRGSVRRRRCPPRPPHARRPRGAPPAPMAVELPPNARQAVARRFPAQPGVRRSRARLGAGPPGDGLQRRRLRRRQDVGHAVPRHRRATAAATTSTCPRATRGSCGSRSSAVRRTRSGSARSPSSRSSGRRRRTRSSPPSRRTRRRAAIPKYLSGEQSYWTVVGVDGDQAEVLVNEEGMVEARKGGFSIEPFVYVGRQAVHVERCEDHPVARRRRTFPSRASRGTARLAADARAGRRAGRPRLVDRVSAVSAREHGRAATRRAGSTSRFGRSR